MKVLELRIRNWPGPALDVEHLPNRLIGVNVVIITTHYERCTAMSKGSPHFLDGKWQEESVAECELSSMRVVFSM